LRKKEKKKGKEKIICPTTLWKKGRVKRVNALLHPAGSLLDLLPLPLPTLLLKKEKKEGEEEGT